MGWDGLGLGRDIVAGSEKVQAVRGPQFSFRPRIPPIERRQIADLTGQIKTIQCRSFTSSQASMQIKFVPRIDGMRGREREGEGGRVKGRVLNKKTQSVSLVEALIPLPLFGTSRKQVSRVQADKHAATSRTRSENCLSTFLPDHTTSQMILPCPLLVLPQNIIYRIVCTYTCLSSRLI